LGRRQPLRFQVTVGLGGDIDCGERRPPRAFAPGWTVAFVVGLDGAVGQRSGEVGR
jgi:hypothetical protein